ncbi:nitroreductase/quinone reductase family protein [Asanoa sp. NPDC049573]|uniref:nitroreductase/quinone reductase family protein n=1 Tax=Asanoa sp. NPDC049573 TaxID=3155396 RepID=UPI003449A7C7
MAREATEIEITTIGRRTGENHSHPVWFIREGKSTFLLPVGGAGSQWYRNLRKNPTIKLGSNSAKARLITDRSKVNQVMDEFASKYGASDVKQYYPGVDVAVEVRDS